MTQRLAELEAAGGSGSAALAFALAPEQQTAGRSAGQAASTLAVAHASGRVTVHTLADDFAPHPAKSRDETRAAWEQKLRELETFAT